MIWWQIFLFVCSSIVSALLAPKPTNAKASSLGDIQAPTAEEGRCITKILGTCKVSGPNCTWYGNLKTKAIKVRSSGFFGIGAQSQTIGYRYYLGMQLALAVGKIDALVDILVGEKSLGVSADFSEAGTLLHVDKENLFGGDQQEGGIAGDLAFYFGSATQQGDSYLAGVFGTPVPGFRGVCHAVLHRMYIGTSPYLKDWAFVLRATPAPAGLPAIWANINGDANPAYGIAEILTCEVEEGGMGVSASRLNLSSYEAAAQTLYEEGFGISLQMDNEQAAEEYLADICRTINATHYTDPSTGLWTLKLVRQDYDPATLPEFGPDDLQEDPEITWPSWPETLNKVVVKYVDRADGFTTGTAQDRDAGNRAIQGVDIATTLEYAMIPNRTVAQMVAGRERRSGAYPLAALRLVFNRKAWALRPGSVFKFNYPPMGIQGLICRVANIRYGRLGDAKISVEAVEDIFAAVPATYTPAPASSWTDPLVDPVPASQQALIEAPYWFVGQSRNVVAVGARGDETTESMDLWTNSGSGYLATGTLDSPTPTGVLSAAWSARTAALDPTGFAIGSGVDLDHLQSTNSDGLYRGANLALVGAEWISWTTITALGFGSYQLSGILRGLLDSVPVDHASGERVWFLAEGAALTSASTDSGGTTVSGVSDVPGLSAALSELSTTVAGKASTTHEATHLPGGSDALPWTTIHGRGTTANKPAAAASNAGYTYFDTDLGKAQRSNGSIWEDCAESGSTSSSALVSAIPAMTSNTTPSGVASASSCYPGSYAYAAFDGLTGGWPSNSVGCPGWLQYQFPSPVVIKSYAIMPWSVDTWNGRVITGWKFQGSNDGSNWTDLDTRSVAAVTWQQFGVKYFNTTNTSAYAYYRLYITSNNGNGIVAVQLLGMFTTIIPKQFGVHVYG